MSLTSDKLCGVEALLRTLPRECSLCGQWIAPDEAKYLFCVGCISEAYFSMMCRANGAEENAEGTIIPSEAKSHVSNRLAGEE